METPCPPDAGNRRPPRVAAGARRLARIAETIRAAVRPFRMDPPTDEDRRACAHQPPNPNISVVVTNYNYQGLVSNALDSLLEQTYRPFEIVVVDDGSTDRSMDVLREYAARHSHLALHQHPNGGNRGLPASLRLGIEKVSGEYVAFCEADDVWTPDHLKEKVRLIQSYREPAWIANDVDLFGDPWRCAKMELANAWRIRSRCRRTINVFSPEEFRRANWVLSFSCCMAKRAALQALDFDGNSWPEHTDWWLWRQMAAQYPLYYVDKKLTAWRMHRSFVTGAAPSPERWNRFRRDMDRLLAQRHPETCGQLLENPLVV